MPLATSGRADLTANHPFYFNSTHRPAKNPPGIVELSRKLGGARSPFKPRPSKDFRTFHHPTPGNPPPGPHSPRHCFGPSTAHAGPRSDRQARDARGGAQDFAIAGGLKGGDGRFRHHAAAIAAVTARWKFPWKTRGMFFGRGGVSVVRVCVCCVSSDFQHPPPSHPA